jgi:transposase-like protein
MTVGQGNDREAEVKQLKRRITILEMERDILKKVIGIFAEPKR